MQKLVRKISHHYIAGQLDKIKVLLAKGVDINAKNGHDKTAIMAAAHGGNLDVVKLLMEKGADVNAKGTPPYDRLKAFLVSIARTLQNRNLSYLVRGPGSTALERARERGHKEIAEYLKAHGAKE